LILQPSQEAGGDGRLPAATTNLRISYELVRAAEGQGFVLHEFDGWHLWFPPFGRATKGGPPAKPV